MGRIKVTGYMDIENFEADELDASHETGLSSTGYDNVMQMTMMELDDVEIESED